MCLLNVQLYFMLLSLNNESLKNMKCIFLIEYDLLHKDYINLADQLLGPDVFSNINSILC